MKSMQKTLFLVVLIGCILFNGKVQGMYRTSFETDMIDEQITIFLNDRNGKVEVKTYKPIESSKLIEKKIRKENREEEENKIMVKLPHLIKPVKSTGKLRILNPKRDSVKFFIDYLKIIRGKDKLNDGLVEREKFNFEIDEKDDSIEQEIMACRMWKREEDLRLIKFTECYFDSEKLDFNWNLIAENMENRTKEECRDRFNDYLINKVISWHPQEYNRLLALMLETNCNLDIIYKKFRSRKISDINYRIYLLKNRFNIKKSKCY